MSNNKIRMEQVIKAITENGLDAFDNNALAKLLSILTPEEVEVFQMKALVELDSFELYERIEECLPIYKSNLNRELYRISNSDAYKGYIHSLKVGNYGSYLRQLNIKELADLKKYITMTKVDTEECITATNKIINMITSVIAFKESQKNLTFM